MCQSRLHFRAGQVQLQRAVPKRGSSTGVRARLWSRRHNLESSPCLSPALDFRVVIWFTQPQIPHLKTEDDNNTTYSQGC